MGTLERLKALEGLSDAELTELVNQAVERGRKLAGTPLSRRECEEQLLGFVLGNQDEGTLTTREQIRKNLNLWPPL